MDTRTNFTFWLMVSIRNSLKMIDKRYFLRHTEGLFFVISSNILEVCYWVCFIFWPLPSAHKHRFSLFCISRALSPSWEACGWMKVLCLLGFFVFLKKISCFCPCLYFSFSQMPLPFWVPWLFGVMCSWCTHHTSIVIHILPHFIPLSHHQIGYK